jgi:hypothetical protein
MPPRGAQPAGENERRSGGRGETFASRNGVIRFFYDRRRAEIGL